MAKRFDGKRVSKKWWVVLTAARRHGVVFQLTSGKRTMAEQWRLVREKGVWSPSNPTGAARPSPFAPHIRVGRSDHAVDINALDGGEARLEWWIEGEGVDWRNTVPGEDWHGEIDADGLTRLYKRYKDLIPLRGDEFRWVAELDRLRRERRNTGRRGVLVRVLTERRKRIWHSAKAEKGGWRKEKRKARYRALLRRTR